jgi:hypothetical protein
MVEFPVTEESRVDGASKAETEGKEETQLGGEGFEAVARPRDAQQVHPVGHEDGHIEGEGSHCKRECSAELGCCEGSFQRHS